MNDDEVHELIVDHYRGESQTLTTGAEANLLKFKELIGIMTDEERARWDDIKKVFKQNTRGGDQKDPVNRVVAQLSGFQTGLEAIQQTLAEAVAKPAPQQPPPQVVIDLESISENLKALQALARQDGQGRAKLPELKVDLTPIGKALESLREAIMERSGPAATGKEEKPVLWNEQLNLGMKALREDLSHAITSVHSGAMAEGMKWMEHEMEMVHSTLATLKDIAKRQRDYLRTVEEMLLARAKEGTVEIQLTQEMLENEQAFLERFHQAIGAEPDESKKKDDPNDAG
jgi:hypothetical protein